MYTNRVVHICVAWIFCHKDELSCEEYIISFLHAIDTKSGVKVVQITPRIIPKELYRRLY